MKMEAGIKEEGEEKGLIPVEVKYENKEQQGSKKRNVK